MKKNNRVEGLSLCKSRATIVSLYNKGKFSIYYANGECVEGRFNEMSLEDVEQWIAVNTKRKDGAVLARTGEPPHS